MPLDSRLLEKIITVEQIDEFAVGGVCFGCDKKVSTALIVYTTDLGQRYGSILCAECLNHPKIVLAVLRGGK